MLISNSIQNTKVILFNPIKPYLWVGSLLDLFCLTRFGCKASVNMVTCNRQQKTESFLFQIKRILFC